MRKRKTKTIAFIDAANIIYGVKKESGFKVDLKKLVDYLKTRFDASRIYYYGGVNTRKVDFKKYQELLKGFGLIPRLKITKFYYQKPKTKRFVCRFCRKRNAIKQRARMRAKANCDVDLTLDVLDNLKDFNHFIFLTGDGDFEQVMVRVKALKKEIYVIASARRTAKVIKKIVAGRFIEIKNLKKIIAKEKGGDTF